MAMACLFLTFLLAVLATGANCDVSPAKSPLEAYWHSMLPYTSMPDAIRNLIHPELDVSSLVKRRVNVPRDRRFLFILHGALPNEAYILKTFFPMSLLINPGSQMNEGTNFTNNIWGNAFVPRPEADAIPFSTKNLPKLFNRFSIASSSLEAKELKEFVQKCEEPGITGETKFCPTSLESMIDNVVSLLGTHDVRALTTTITKSQGTEQDGKIVYKSTGTIRKLADHAKWVICHPQPFPQAMYYCHTNTMYEAYSTPLIGSDGSTVNALTICHHNYVSFNKGYLRVLKVNPRTPICHFLQENQIIWVWNDQSPVASAVSNIHKKVGIKFM